MAIIGEPDRWWYEPETDPLAVPVPELIEPSTVTAETSVTEPAEEVPAEASR